MRGLWGTVFTIALVGGSSSSWAADLPEIEKSGRLRVVAGSGEQPEMFSFRSGSDPGFERELLEGFARLHGLKLEVTAVKSWDERIPTLLRGDGDVIIGIVDTEQRRKQIAFTSEVLPARHLVVTARPYKVIATVEELRGEKVGVVRGTSWAQAALEAGVPADQVEPYPDTEPVLAALRSGEVTATVMALNDFTLATKRHPELQAGTFLGPPGRAAWGLRKSDTKLQAALDEYLGNVRRTPTWGRLVVKYFGEKALVILGKVQTP